MLSRFLKLATFALLLIGGVPWYWHFIDTPVERLWGMPTWFVTSVLLSLFVSVLTAMQFAKPWPVEANEQAQQESTE